MSKEQSITCNQCGIEAFIPTVCAVCLAPFTITTTPEGEVLLSCPHLPEGEPMAKKKEEPREASTRDVVPGFGKAVKARREAMGLTTAQLGERAGTHQTTVSKIENESRAPSLSLAIKLAAGLRVGVETLIREGSKLS